MKRDTYLLSERELEVVRLLAVGHTSEEIANKLHISVHTVNNHRKNMLGKTQVKNTAALLRVVMVSGIV